MKIFKFQSISLFFVLILFGFCNNDNSVAPVNYEQVLLIGEVTYPLSDTSRTDTVKNAQGTEYIITHSKIPITSADILVIRADTVTTSSSYRAQTDTAGIWQCFVKPNSYKICAVYFDVARRLLITDSVFYNAIPTERIQVVPTIVSEGN